MNFLWTLILLGVVSASLYGQQAPPEQTIVAIANKSLPAVVLIQGVTTDGSQIRGSGFLFSSDGKIITNVHVIREFQSGGVKLSSGDVYDVFNVLAFDERKDIAIIQIAGFDLPTIQLGNSNNLQVGESVVALGNPFGLTGSTTTGVVSAVRDDPRGGSFKVVQTDAAVNEGNSGGPLLNGKGEAIAVVFIKRIEAQNISFAIPINYVRGLIEAGLKSRNLAEFRAELSNKTTVFSKGFEGFPREWRSLISGRKKTIRLDGDRVYVETVLPEGESKVGCSMIAELQKQGEVYTGVNRYHCLWE